MARERGRSGTTLGRSGAFRSPAATAVHLAALCYAATKGVYCAAMAVSKCRPSWRVALHEPTNRNPTPPSGGMRLGAVPDRFRCCATARSTGERCKQPALHGGVCCGKHGGHLHAYKTEQVALGDKPMLSTAAVRYGRVGLAAIGATVDKSVSRSIIQRGLWLERALNGLGDDETPGDLLKLVKPGPLRNHLLRRFFG